MPPLRLTLVRPIPRRRCRAQSRPMRPPPPHSRDRDRAESGPIFCRRRSRDRTGSRPVRSVPARCARQSRAPVRRARPARPTPCRDRMRSRPRARWHRHVERHAGIEQVDLARAGSAAARSSPDRRRVEHDGGRAGTEFAVLCMPDADTRDIGDQVAHSVLPLWTIRITRAGPEFTPSSHPRAHAPSALAPIAIRVHVNRHDTGRLPVSRP